MEAGEMGSLGGRRGAPQNTIGGTLHKVPHIEQFEPLPLDKPSTISLLSSENVSTTWPFFAPACERIWSEACFGIC